MEQYWRSKFFGNRRRRKEPRGSFAEEDPRRRTRVPRVASSEGEEVTPECIGKSCELAAQQPGPGRRVAPRLAGCGLGSSWSPGAGSRSAYRRRSGAASSGLAVDPLASCGSPALRPLPYSDGSPQVWRPATNSRRRGPSLAGIGSGSRSGNGRQRKPASSSTDGSSKRPGSLEESRRVGRRTSSPDGLDGSSRGWGSNLPPGPPSRRERARSRRTAESPMESLRCVSRIGFLKRSG